MKDPKHIPKFCIIGAQLRAEATPYRVLNGPIPAVPVFGCNNRFGLAANDDKEKPSRA